MLVNDDIADVLPKQAEHRDIWQFSKKEGIFRIRVRIRTFLRTVYQ